MLHSAHQALLAVLAALFLACNPFQDVGSQCEVDDDCPSDAFCHDYNCDGDGIGQWQYCTINCTTHEDCWKRYDLQGGDHVYCVGPPGEAHCMTRGSCG